MKRFTYFKIIPIHVSIIVLFISIFARSAVAKGKARLSYSVAQAVCKSTAAFAMSNQIEPLSKSPTVKDKPCKTLTWSNCETRGNSTSACQKFKLKDCPAQSQSQPQRSKERKISRIINGTNAKPHEFPHLVRITRNDGPHCDGTIWNENYIITAGHCVFGLWGEGKNHTFKVIAGDHNTKVIEDTEQIRTVANAIYHENYNPQNVLPPDMPQPDYDALGDVVTVAGWGLLTPNGSKHDLPDILQKVDLTVYLPERCEEIYGINTTYVICADSDGGGQTPCRGDSGGPLTKKLDNGRHLFLGVVSFGDGCLDINPSVYTKISAYLGWINTITEDC